jgi:hypothetical protein
LSASHVRVAAVAAKRAALSQLRARAGAVSWKSDWRDAISPGDEIARFGVVGATLVVARTGRGQASPLPTTVEPISSCVSRRISFGGSKHEAVLEGENRFVFVAATRFEPVTKGCYENTPFSSLGRRA